MIVQRTIRIKWILQIEGWNILFFFIYGFLACALYSYYEHLSFPVSEISVLGIAVAILLGFRNNEAYNRYWEARTAWSDLMNYSRNFASQVMGYVQNKDNHEPDLQNTTHVHKELIYRQLAFLNVLRLQLRQEESWDEIKPFLSDSEFKELETAVNKATLINHKQSVRLKELYKSGWLEKEAYVYGLMVSIKELFAAQGRCERIKSTPLPRQYGFFTKLFVWVFVLLLPFGLVQHLGWGTLPIYIILATIFTITELIGSRTEEPFEGKLEDVAMSSICRKIEIDLRQQLGETKIPPLLEPKEGVLM
jgi:ion channel-forming bestrophin family protein